MRRGWRSTLPALACTALLAACAGGTGGTARVQADVRVSERAVQAEAVIAADRAAAYRRATERLLRGLPECEALVPQRGTGQRLHPLLRRHRWARPHAPGADARAWLLGGDVPGTWDDPPEPSPPQSLPERPAVGPPCPGGPCPGERPSLRERAEREHERHYDPYSTGRPWRWSDRLRPGRRAYGAP